MLACRSLNCSAERKYHEKDQMDGEWWRRRPQKGRVSGLRHLAAQEQDLVEAGPIQGQAEGLKCLFEVSLEMSYPGAGGGVVIDDGP